MMESRANNIGAAPTRRVVILFETWDVSTSNSPTGK